MSPRHAAARCRAIRTAVCNPGGSACCGWTVDCGSRSARVGAVYTDRSTPCGGSSDPPTSSGERRSFSSSPANCRPMMSYGRTQISALVVGTPNSEGSAAWVYRGTYRGLENQEVPSRAGRRQGNVPLRPPGRPPGQRAGLRRPGSTRPGLSALVARGGLAARRRLPTGRAPRRPAWPGDGSTGAHECVKKGRLRCVCVRGPSVCRELSRAAPGANPAVLHGGVAEAEVVPGEGEVAVADVRAAGVGGHPRAVIGGGSLPPRGRLPSTTRGPARLAAVPLHALSPTR